MTQWTTKMSETKSDHNNNISKKTVIDNYNVAEMF